MRTLLIACGNPLRGDDGVAAEVLRLMAASQDRELCAVHQLTPEIAEKVGGFERVFFLDADVTAAELTIDAVPAAVPHSPLSHASSPAEIVGLARALFGFRGEALICRIPASNLSAGGRLTPETHRLAEELARHFTQ